MAHVERYCQCRLVDGFVVQHERHITVDAYVSLFATVDFMLEVGREIYHAMHNLMPHERLRLGKGGAMVGHFGVGRGIKPLCELAAAMRVRHIDHCHRHVLDHFVVVYP